jgi:tight adherence protein C
MSALLLVALLGIFVSLGATVVVFGLAATERRQVGRSLAAIRHGSELQDAVGDSFGSRVVAPAAARLAVLADHLSPDGAAEAVARRLDQAGNPRGLDVQRVFALKGAGLALLALGGASLGSSRGAALLVLYTLAGAAIGFFLPDLLIYNQGLKRQDAIRRDCADALDLLVIGVEAGLGFDASLSQVAQKTEGPLAAEFVRVLQEMRIGQGRTQAFRDLAARCTVPEIHSLVGALVQADKLGVPIAHVLREQAKEMRLRRRQRAEEQAMKIPVKILFPMVSCILPAMFVVVLGPGAISIAHTLAR